MYSDVTLLIGELRGFHGDGVDSGSMRKGGEHNDRDDGSETTGA